jgi:hypothetical protein
VGRGGSDRILEVLPSGLKGLLQNVAIDGSDTEEFEEGQNKLFRGGFTQLTGEKIMDCGYGVGREEAFGLAGFHCGTYGCASVNVGLSVEEHVENDVGVQEEALFHKYFLTRCLR